MVQQLFRRMTFLLIVSMTCRLAAAQGGSVQGSVTEKSGEPMKSCFGYGELEKMLEKHHFLIYEFLNRVEIQNRYFAECNNEMSAFENVNYAQSVLFGKHR